jgi:hypothetical protein
MGSFNPIAIVGEIPVTDPAHTTGVLPTTGRDRVLEITGQVMEGAGELYLLRWFADLSQWRPWRSYHSITVNAEALDGFFDAAYEILPGNEYWLLYDPSSSFIATAYGRGRPLN